MQKLIKDLVSRDTGWKTVRQESLGKAWNLGEEFEPNLQMYQTIIKTELRYTNQTAVDMNLRGEERESVMAEIRRRSLIEISWHLYADAVRMLYELERSIRRGDGKESLVLVARLIEEINGEEN